VRQLNIDWLALVGAFQMNMPEVQCFLSLRDGRVLKLRPGDRLLAVVRSEPTHYLFVPPIPSIIQYQWVDEFILAIPGEDMRELARTAINGKGAFRRFKDLLTSHPEERRRWFEFRDEKMRQRVVEWVWEQGLQAANEPPWEHTGPTFAPAPINSSHDIEALRDFFVYWADSQVPQADLTPITLENLAEEVGKRFVLRSVQPADGRPEMLNAG
jgi:hypothetical protein